MTRKEEISILMDDCVHNIKLLIDKKYSNHQKHNTVVISNGIIKYSDELKNYIEELNNLKP